MSGISNALKKLLTYFNGTTILALSIFLLAPLVAVLPKRLDFHVKDFELFALISLAVLSGGSSRLY